MTAQPHRFTDQLVREPVLHEISPLRLATQQIALLLSVRQDDDGDWCARMLFHAPDRPVLATAEIFRGRSEAELWQSVRQLPEHHVRALFLSLV